MTTTSSHRRTRSALTMIAAATGAIALAATAITTAGSAGAAPGTISGVVRTSTGAEQSDLRVRFIGNDDSKPAAVTPNASGAWSLPWTSSECGFIEFSSASGYWQTVRTDADVCSGDTLPETVLGPGGVVSGRVKGHVPGVSTAIAYDKDWVIRGQAWISSDGTYRLGGLPGDGSPYTVGFEVVTADRYQLDTIWATPNQQTFLNVEPLTDADNPPISSLVWVNDRATTTVAVVPALTVGTTTEGSLTCPNGQPPAQVQGYAEPARVGWPVKARLGVSTGASGRFSITGINTGLSYWTEAWGCRDPDGHLMGVFSGNTLNPHKARRWSGEAPPAFEAFDARTARMFKDVTMTTKFAADIQWMLMQGVAGGYGDDTFRPVTPVRRDAMAAFLFRLAGAPEDYQPSWCDFVDINPSTQFYREMCWMRENGISSGWAGPRGQEYRPLAPVNRDAMAHFLWVFGGEVATPLTRPFADVPSGMAFEKEMTWMYNAGISTGWLEGGKRLYKPLQAVNRDAMSAFLNRYVQWYRTQPQAAASTAGSPSAAAATTAQRLAQPQARAAASRKDSARE